MFQFNLNYYNNSLKQCESYDLMTESKYLTETIHIPYVQASGKNVVTHVKVSRENLRYTNIKPP